MHKPDKHYAQDKVALGNHLYPTSECFASEHDMARVWNWLQRPSTVMLLQHTPADYLGYD